MCRPAEALTPADWHRVPFAPECRPAPLPFREKGCGAAETSPPKLLPEGERPPAEETVRPRCASAGEGHAPSPEYPTVRPARCVIVMRQTASDASPSPSEGTMPRLPSALVLVLVIALAPAARADFAL